MTVDMDRIEMLTESFKMKYEKFKNDCNDVQNTDAGEGFYGYDLSTVALRLIAADNIININEVKFYNRLFDFDYTSTELLEIYRGCSDMLLTEAFEPDFESAFTRLKNIDKVLAFDYKELLSMLCEIIISCDGDIDDSEVEEVDKLKELCV